MALALGTVCAIALATKHGVQSIGIRPLTVMCAVTMLGITMEYQRSFAHRSPRTSTFGRRLLVVLGSTPAQGLPLVAIGHVLLASQIARSVWPRLGLACNARHDCRTP